MIDDRPTKTIILTFDKKILKQLKRAAIENKQTISELVEDIATEWLKAGGNNTYTNTYTQEKADSQI